MSRLRVGDDARGVAVVPLARALRADRADFAFDHAEVLRDYARTFHPSALDPPAGPAV
jgi:hypothetical protein